MITNKMEIAAITPRTELNTIYTLFSGSTGNSVFVRSGNTAILIDAGMSAKALETALNNVGETLKNISAIFITHEHSDHIRGLDVITRRLSIPVHVALASAPYIKCADEYKVVHPPRYNVHIGELEVSSFCTPHDSHGSVGYTVCGEGLHFGLATDLGMMTDTVMERLCECDSVVLESNHDVAMLLNGSYPFELKQRILSRFGHLSNNDCADSVVTLSRNGVQNILLAHLSAENNRPHLALSASANALEACGRHSTSVNVAAVATPTRLI